MSEFFKAPLGEDHPALKTRAQRDMLEYLRMRAWTTGRAWPHLQTIADDLKLSTRQCQRILKQLADSGLISMLEQGGTKGRFYDANVWSVTPSSSRPAEPREPKAKKPPLAVEAREARWRREGVRLGLHPDFVGAAGDVIRLKRQAASGGIRGVQAKEKLKLMHADLL